MSVPDHLIEKAAQAAFEVLSPDWTIATDFDRRFYLTTAHAALSAVADELRAEGARAEREKIAARLEEMAEHAHGKEAHHTGADFAYAAHVVRSREGVRDAS